MKKKIQYSLIALSACFFIYLFIQQIITVSHIFKNPDTFTLMPALVAVILLVVLLCHVGLYVLLMDKKDMKFIVQDDDEWWTKWDMV